MSARKRKEYREVKKSIEVVSKCLRLEQIGLSNENVQECHLQSVSTQIINLTNSSAVDMHFHDPRHLCMSTNSNINCKEKININPEVEHNSVNPTTEDFNEELESVLENQPEHGNDELSSKEVINNSENPTSGNLNESFDLNEEFESILENQPEDSDDERSSEEVINNSENPTPGNCNESFGFNEELESVLQTQPKPSDEHSCEKFLNDSLRCKLKVWAIKHQITQSAIRDLLVILREENVDCDLPLDARTLISQKKSAINANSVVQNNICYFGLKKGIARSISSGLSRQKFVTTNQGLAKNLSLSTNVDGLSVFKSCNSEFWPVLCVVNESVDPSPFVVLIYYGISKPDDVDVFLADFITELKELSSVPFLIGTELYILSLNGPFICDAPARAYLKRIKGHSGYYSCDKCTVEGDWENKVIMVETTQPLRTDETFKEQQQPEHHHGVSPLMSLKIGMVTQFPLEYMHLVCLGVMRRLLYCWLKGKYSFKIRGHNLEIFDSAFQSLAQYIPREFSRKPRPFSQIDRFKATELRQLLLYTAPVLLKSIPFPQAVYDHFMLLHGAISLLVRPYNEQSCNDAAMLLKIFVEHSLKIYGRGFLVYNVHNLIHIANDVHKYGPLDNFSAFKFENALHYLKNMIHSPKNPLEQIRRRLLERDGNYLKSQQSPSRITQFPAVKIRHDGELPPGVTGECYKMVHVSHDLTLHVAKGDNCCCLVDGTIIVVKNIFLDSGNGNVFLQANKFNDYESFYKYPFDSSSVLNQHIVSSLSEEIAVYPLSSVAKKCILLPYQQKMVALPFIHQE